MTKNKYKLPTSKDGQVLTVKNGFIKWRTPMKKMLEVEEYLEKRNDLESMNWFID